MKTFFVLCALLFLPKLSAQVINVYVNDTNGPLGLANIYLNGVHIANANSEGMAGISEELLTISDTLSSSYLGYMPSSIVYDEEMRATHSCILTLTKEQYNYIDEIVVYGNKIGGWEAFSRYVEPLKVLPGKYELKGNFLAEINTTDSLVVTTTGTFTSLNRINRRLGPPVEFATQNDITMVLEKLKQKTFFAQFVASGLIAHLHSVHNSGIKDDPYRTLIYLGLQNGAREFVFTYTSPEIRGSNQVFIRVNEKTERVELLRFSSTAERGTQSLINSLTMRCEQYDNPKNNNNYTIPSMINVNFRMDDDGHQINLVLSDIIIEKEK